MNRRSAIALTAEEQAGFIEDARTIILSTIDHRGYPHSVAMWYVLDDGCVLMTTYRKSQKAVNVRRNSKVSLLVESGVTYESLKGVLMRGDAEVIDDEGRCLAVLSRVHKKMHGSIPEGVDEALRMQARKRVVIKVTPKRISSWDHGKLGGAY